MNEKSYLKRHKFISFLVDLNLPGVNRIAVLLSKILIPSTKGSYILNTIHGIKLLIDPSKDQGVEKSLHDFGTYEKGIIDFIAKNLKKNHTFLDVGANIGLMTCFASKIVGTDGEILAFEANPKTVELLNQNLELNACSNVQVFSVGLGDEKTKALFYENWEVNRGGASFLNQGNESGIEVEIETIDNLFQNQHIGMVKIDVEGFELKVLKGGEKVLKASQPIFIVEVSSNRELTKGVSPNEIREFILSLGSYKIYKLAGTKERISKLVEIKTESDLPSHDNLICIPS